MSRVLVTGAAGYIGSILCGELLRAGHSVTALDNFMYGQQSLNHLCAVRTFDLVRGDARNPAILRPLAEWADFLVPLAAIVGAPACDRDLIAAETTNLGGVAQLAQWAILQGKRIIYPNTNSGYGVGGADLCTEESPLRPVSAYGRLKVAAEGHVLAAGGVALRLATVFGMSPRMRLDLLVNDFVRRAVRDRSIVVFEGRFRRNYVHIRDVARAFSMAIERYDEMSGQAFNVGLSDANLTKLELCGIIRNQVPGLQILEASIGEDPDKRDYLVSNARIEALGWRPLHSLEEGILELLKGFRALPTEALGNA